MKFLPFLLLAGTCAAQSISPIVTECGMKCKGEFTVTNTSVKPIVVILDVNSFKVENGKEITLPLNSNTNVQLDRTSARISPQGSYTFGYKVFCDSEPCMTAISAAFAAGKTPNGFLVMIRLPHIIYSCSKQRGCRAKALGGQP